ncbi:MAG: hypothetical protein IKM33_00620 [Clostridia bacterium]|nr:hypothetical protein [Clostridia bacterium]
MKYIFRYIFPLLVLLCGALTACDGEISHEHTVESWQTVESPTCTETGLALGSCSVCHKIIDTVLPMPPHTLTETIVSPTCTEEGYTRYTCACGYTYDSDTTPPAGHSLTKAVTPPTCTEEGYTRYTCACGYTYDGDHTPPTGHSLTKTVTPPTCTEEGFTRYTCACGYTYDGDHTPPTGHDLTPTVAVPPTCTEEGYTRYACSVCDHEEDGDPIPALNHANTVESVFAPTVLRDGYTLHTCTDCGYSYEDEPVLYRDLVTGAYTDNTEILMQGIDTSKWNHDYGVSLEDMKPLDWEALKAAGVDFVILKAGSTKGIDPAFELDYRDAKAAGLQVGAYFYTYATTAEEILADAELLLSWLEGKQFEFPIYLDMEDSTLMDLGSEVLTEMCEAFVARLQEERYYAALYTNTEWLYNLLDTEWAVANLDVWYARYTSVPEESEGFTLTDGGFVWKDGTASKPGQTDRRFGVWQYTNCGVVEGFRYNFDLNYAFKDYASIMTRWGLNGFSPEVSVPETV